MKIIECAQYSPEYWDAHRARPSASNFSRIMTAKKMEASAQIEDYIAELIAERVSFTPPFFTERGGHTEAMRNGIDTEPEARRWYEMERGLTVRQVGLCIDDADQCCCSPDGLIDPDGGLELKCPLLKTHARYVMDGKVPMDYLAQVHGSLIVTGRKWWDFMSYAPGLSPLLIRVTPNEFTDKLRAALKSFWERYMEAVEKIVAREGEAVKTPPAVQAGIDEELRKWQDRLAGCDSPNVAEVCTKVNALLPALREVAPAAKQACWAETKRKMTEIGCVWHADYKTFGTKE